MPLNDNAEQTEETLVAENLLLLLPFPPPPHPPQLPAAQQTGLFIRFNEQGVSSLDKRCLCDMRM